MFKILRSHLHYDVIVTSYADGWYLFWYHWKEQTHSYTLVANIGYRTFIIENPEGVATTPCGGRVTENTSGGQGLIKAVI